MIADDVLDDAFNDDEVGKEKDLTVSRHADELAPHVALLCPIKAFNASCAV